MVRRRLAAEAADWWAHLFPWDTGAEYDEIMRSTQTEGAWGDGRHMALASMVYQVRVMGSRGSRIHLWRGELWQIRFDARAL